MMTEQMGNQLEMYCYMIEDLVPEDNEFRKIHRQQAHALAGADVGNRSA